MSTAQKELQLLKSYVHTLEAENKSRNQQRQTLERYIDTILIQNSRLLAELENLRKGAKVSVQPDLNTVKQHYQQQIALLQQNLMNLDKMYCSLQEESNRVMLQYQQHADSCNNEQMVRKCSQLSKQNQNLRQQILVQQTKYNQDMDRLLREAEQKDHQLNESSLLNRSGTDTNLYQKEIQILKSQNKRLQEGTKCLVDELNQIEQIIKNNQIKYINQRVLLSNQNAQIRNQYEELKQNNRQLQQSLSNSHQKLKDLEQQEYERYKSLEAQFDKVVIEREDLRIKIQYANVEINKLNNTVSQLELNQSENRNLKQQKRRVQQENQQLVRDLAKAKENVDSLIRQNQSLHNIPINPITNSKQDTNLLKQQVSKLIFTNYALTKQLNHMESENDKLKSEIGGLKQSNQHLKSQLKEDQLSGPRSQVFNSRSESEGLLKQKISRLREDILNSSSQYRNSEYHNEDLMEKKKKTMYFKQQLDRIALMQPSYYTPKMPQKIVKVPELKIEERSSNIGIDKAKKWQNLQKRITALKIQNDSLKKTLWVNEK